MPGALELAVPANSRPCAVEPLRAGDFVLRTTSLRGWTAAILKVLHDSLQKRKWFTEAIQKNVLRQSKF